jgi:hypothetical protein
VLLLLEKDKRFERHPLKSHRKQNSAAWIGRVLSAVVRLFITEELNYRLQSHIVPGEFPGHLQYVIVSYRFVLTMLQTY